jgi:hypothetical protein
MTTPPELQPVTAGARRVEIDAVTVLKPCAAPLRAQQS